ncbi:Holliday junction ATP-dependent DNA helicase RuvB [Candidatus Neptunochlamydia vexilliferae]|uniref:Holliday junction branch migration complex subunit RuvB n=2 Tax=Candidatus Neptunichlamydia vexilliferae TaxID=1651774 RepID=A0ABS0AYS0_9BACT|nr:Holliday junction ATP-dependent DNA helicase RuvB [Candidatus Neptunochlamydia vexilliferae]
MDRIMTKPPFVESSWTKRDQKLEQTLRPQSLKDFVGQPAVKEKLEVFIGAAKQRGEALGHSLFCGPPGLGKTTLANIVACEMGTSLITTSGPTIEKPADLAGILTNLKEGDILFIDEIHRLNKTVEEYLYPAMEDFTLDLLLDSGPQARSVQVKLNPFTLVGATTRMGLLSAPLRSRFGFNCRLNYYDSDIVSEILSRSSSILSVEINSESIFEIARRARGTPRIANNLLKWVRDYAQMRNDNKLDKIATRTALEMLDIDFRGLDEMDKRMLEHIIDHHQGGPVGISTIATALGEEATTLEEVNEPFLIMQGLLKRTQRGREATKLAYQHLGKI